MYFPQRQWIFSTEIRGLTYSHRTPNLTGDGHAMMWKAGAVIAGAESSSPGGAGPYGYPQYGYGNAQNTWYACTMVDANGKEIPWVDRDGNVLKTVSERYRPAPGQRFFISGGGEGPDHRWQGPRMLPIKGQAGPPGGAGGQAIDAEMPLYADLPSMPEQERRVIFGLMIGQEGKTQIPIYRTYTQAGFDPDKDLLQGYSMEGFPKWRQMGGGGVVAGGGPVTDWDLMTTLGWALRRRRPGILQRRPCLRRGYRPLGRKARRGIRCRSRRAAGRAAARSTRKRPASTHP